MEERTNSAKFLYAVLERLQAQSSGKGVRDPKEGDRDGRRCRRSGIASQTLGPRKSPMCPLSTGKRSRWWRLSRWGRISLLDNDLLATKELDHLPPMEATLPISPEDRVDSRLCLRRFMESGGGDDGMEYRTDAPWFLSGGPVPLALLPQRTGTTMPNASSIHHPQSPITLRASFLGVERMISKTAQGAIWLEDKILPGHPAQFPGGGKGGYAVRSRWSQGLA